MTLKNRKGVITVISCVLDLTEGEKTRNSKEDGDLRRAK